MIAITSIIKNRAWILPDFLACLAALDYPKDQLTCIFIDDASTDATPAILADFRARYGGAYAGIEIIRHEDALDDATSARDTTDRGHGYPHLAALRNEALDAANACGADYQLSIDSDILAAPGLLAGLLARGLPYVASVIFNDLEGGANGIAINTSIRNRITNAGGLFPNGWRPMRDYEFNTLYPCGYSGAVYLVDRATLTSGARFGGENPDPLRSCEDYSYCWALQIRDIPRHIDTTLRAVHVMLPDYQQEARGVYYAWFAAFPFGPLPGAVAPFDVATWDRNGGPEQSRGFMNLILTGLAPDIRQDIAKGKTFMDVGCALGDGLDVLATALGRKGRTYTGTDITSDGLAEAARRHPGFAYQLLDPDTAPAPAYDVLTCSNVLEHLDRPWSMLEGLCQAARTVIILVPHNEDYHRDPTRTHRQRLTAAAFPAKIGRHARRQATVLPCPEHSSVPQLLVVYQEEEEPCR